MRSASSNIIFIPRIGYIIFATKFVVHRNKQIPYNVYRYKYANVQRDERVNFAMSVCIYAN